MADAPRRDHGFLCGTRVLVAGFGIAGRSAARALLDRHAIVDVTTDSPVVFDDDVSLAEVGLPGSLDRLPLDEGGDPAYETLIVSPGYPPTHPLLVDAAKHGDLIEVWGELELAWQLRGGDADARPVPVAPWLALTGTNGKTTTVHMLESILRAAGLRVQAVGNVGEPIIDAVASGEAEVLAVEVSSQQLHFAPSIRPAAGAVLNLAPDHLNWHGSFEAYAQAKFRIWDAARAGGGSAIGNLDDPLVAAAMPPDAVGFTLGEPATGQLGVVDGRLVSRAFGDDGLTLAEVDDVHPPGQHNVANALAAAALARAHGVNAGAIAAGLRAFVPDPHRNQSVLVRDGVEWVDDSKATNPHAAAASLAAYPHIVWVAGGQLKGVDVDDLVAATAGRLRGAVLLGQDRALVAAALTRHAPEVPVIMVESTDDGAMTEVVRAAAGLARPGDTVLLAPAAASYDMFSGYGARGDAFAAAARALGDVR